jgi:hypothetical protein
MAYRSAQMQARALAGEEEFADYVDADTLWYDKNTLSVLEAKSFKDLTYISKDWSSQVIEDRRTVDYDYGNDPSLPRTYETVSPDDYGPQGNTDNWFTQTERYDSF